MTMLMNHCIIYMLVLYGMKHYVTSRPHDSIKYTSTPQQFNGSFTHTSNLSRNNSQGNQRFQSYSNNKTKIRILTHPGNGNRGQYLGEYVEQDIIFPDAYQVTFEPVPRIDGAPNCANGSTFCENVSSYPYHHVQDVLKRSRFQNDYFGQDDIPVDYSINNRVGEIPDLFVCDSIERTIFPQIGKNKNNKWKYIINQSKQEGFVQGVRVETCARPDVPCAIIGELPGGYVTSCKQKFIYRRLMSLTEHGEPVPDTFQLPSACCCSYRKDQQFFSRMGAQITPRPATKR